MLPWTKDCLVLLMLLQGYFLYEWGPAYYWVVTDHGTIYRSGLVCRDVAFPMESFVLVKGVN